MGVIHITGIARTIPPFMVVQGYLHGIIVVVRSFLNEHTFSTPGVYLHDLIFFPGKFSFYPYLFSLSFSPSEGYNLYLNFLAWPSHSIPVLESIGARDFRLKHNWCIPSHRTLG